MAGSPDVLLQVENLFLAFGGVVSLNGVSLEVRRGEIFSLIGPNGAGKTSLLNCINGLYRPQRGHIRFEGREITRLPAHRRAQLGIARTFQKIELFKHMTVLDNVRLGRHIHMKSNLLDALIYWGRAEREELAHRAFIEEEILDLLEIGHLRHRIVGMLP